MKIKRINLQPILIGFLSLCSAHLWGQVTVTGPVCVVPATQYQYLISGTWDSASTMQVCITGGVLADSTAQSCTVTGPPLASVMIIWNSTSTASLTVTSSSGNGSLSITITMPLVPGNLDSGSMIQTIGYDSIPGLIICSADSGGSCAPSYTDQWQASIDQVGWSDISGATGQNLDYGIPLTITTYFRRKVTEGGSSTIAYSRVVSVNVNPVIPVSDSTSRRDSTSIGSINDHGKSNLWKERKDYLALATGYFIFNEAIPADDKSIKTRKEMIPYLVKC
jgi:hypothetical protein